MSKTLKLEDSTARKLYKTADSELKTILEESFGKEFFSEKITDRIKTFSDVLVNALAWFESNKDGRDIVTKVHKAVYDICSSYLKGAVLSVDSKIRLISFILNEGWTEDYSNVNQSKYYPYFVKESSGWVLGSNSSRVQMTISGFGCSYKSSELALYAGEMFLSEYKDWLPE